MSALSPELHTLGTRAVVCSGWRWMAGMLATEGGGPFDSTWVFAVRRDGLMQVVDTSDPDLRVWFIRVVRGHWIDFRTGEDYGRLIPDLRDPGTLGCFEALLSALYPGVTYFAPTEDWGWMFMHGLTPGRCLEISAEATKTEAAVVALEWHAEQTRIEAKAGGDL